MNRKLAALLAAFALAGTAHANCTLDIDNDGRTNAATDGLLAIRYMLGFRGNALVADAVNTLGLRTGATAIESFLSVDCATRTPGPPGFVARGIWRGSLNTGRKYLAFATDDGQLWGVYSQVPTVPNPNPATVAGFFQGQMSASGNNISSNDARDYGFEYATTVQLTLAGTVVPATSLSVTASSVFLPLPPVVATGNYLPSSTQNASLAQLTGNYLASYGSTTLGIGTGSFNVSALGLLTSVTAFCSISAQFVPRANENLFDVAVTFSDGQCAYPLATMRGVAFYDTIFNQVYLSVLNSERNAGFSLVGNKLP
jgi:hypothetical protein